MLRRPCREHDRIELSHPFARIGSRADRDEHLRSIRRERDVARIMAAGGQPRHYGFRLAACREVAVAIRKAHDRTGIGDVDPFGIRAGRIERNAERGGETRCKHLAARLAGIRGPQHANPAGTAFCDEDIAIGRSPNKARLIEPLSEQADLEARRHHRLLASRAARYPHAVRKRGAEVCGRQVRRPDVPAQARPVRAPIGECRAALEQPGALTGRSP